MKKISVAVIGIAMSLVLAACGTAPAAPAEKASPAQSAKTQSSSPEKTYTLKLGYTPGSLAPTESPDIMYAETFKKLVEERSKGALKVDLYPSGQLGSAAEVMQGIVAGNVEMAIVDINMLNSLYEPSMLLSTPGLFNSVEECDAMLSGDWGKSFAAKVKEATGIKLLDMHSKGFRNFTTSNKELRTVEDAKGVTFRVMESPVSIKMVEALGAKAVPMPGSEMYVAMQNGVVDGQENPVLNIIQDKTYEVQKYLVLDAHIAGIMSYVMNGKLFDSLPAELQNVIEKASAEAMEEAKKVVEAKNREGVQILKDKGMIVYEPTAEELKEWHATVFEPTQAYVRSTIGDEPVDELMKALEAYRK